MLSRFTEYGNNRLVPCLRRIAAEFPGIADLDREDAIKKINEAVVRDSVLMTSRVPTKNVEINVENIKILSRMTVDYLNVPSKALFSRFAVREGPIDAGIEQRTDAWFAARSTLITASGFGAILGLNPYEKPMKFMEKKVNGETFSPFSYENMNRGTCFEDIIIDFLGSMTGCSRPQDAGLIVSETFPFLGASPDGYIEDLGPLFPAAPFRDCLVECKAPNARTTLSGVPKPMYWAQMQLQMLCAEKTQCIFVEGKVRYFRDKYTFLTGTATKDAFMPSFDLSALGMLPPGITHEQEEGLEPDSDMFPQKRFNDRYLADAAGMPKGIVVTAGLRTRDFKYRHIDGSLDVAEQLALAQKTEDEYRDLGYEDAETKFWYLEDAAFSLVYRDDVWLEDAVARAKVFFEETFAPAMQAARDATELAAELAVDA